MGPTTPHHQQSSTKEHGRDAFAQATNAPDTDTSTVQEDSSALDLRKFRAEGSQPSSPLEGIVAPNDTDINTEQELAWRSHVVSRGRRELINPGSQSLQRKYKLDEDDGSDILPQSPSISVPASISSKASSSKVSSSNFSGVSLTQPSSLSSAASSNFRKSVRRPTIASGASTGTKPVSA